MANRWWAGNLSMNPKVEDKSNQLRSDKEQEFMNTTAAAAATATTNSSENPNEMSHEGEENIQSPEGLFSSGPSSSTHRAGRRPRGRPMGSKNKPKPPIVVTKETPNSLKSHKLTKTIVHLWQKDTCHRETNHQSLASTTCSHPLYFSKNHPLS